MKRYAGLTGNHNCKNQGIKSPWDNKSKTRKMIADACMFAMDEIYENGKWQHLGSKQPSLVITTELEPEEVQTMMTAFVANVTEGHILNADFKDGEEARIEYAIQQIEKAPLWIEQLSDFSLRDIENTIRRYVRENGVKYICSIGAV